MSLPQYVWDIIHNDQRFIAASTHAKRRFLRAAKQATWNIGHEHAREAARIFDKALEDAFGPRADAMQPTTEERKQNGT